MNVEEFIKEECPMCEHYKDINYKLCKIMEDIQGNVKCTNEKRIDKNV